MGASVARGRVLAKLFRGFYDPNPAFWGYQVDCVASCPVCVQERLKGQLRFLKLKEGWCLISCHG
eukprot:7998162-Lingulodinium_polyedra.AAC.1